MGVVRYQINYSANQRYPVLNIPTLYISVWFRNSLTCCVVYTCTQNSSPLSAVLTGARARAITDRPRSQGSVQHHTAPRHPVCENSLMSERMVESPIL